jgi:hypothetical protein
MRVLAAWVCQRGEEADEATTRTLNNTGPLSRCPPGTAHYVFVEAEKGDDAIPSGYFHGGGSA